MENTSHEHNQKAQSKKNCLTIFIIVLIIVVSLSGFIFIKTKIWFHEFAQSARQAAEQGRDSVE